MFLEPSPAVEKTLQPGKWYGHIALLCALEPVLFWGFLLLHYYLENPWIWYYATYYCVPILGVGSLLFPLAGIVFGILGRNTEGKLYARIGIVLSLLYIVPVYIHLAFAIPQAREAARKMQCSSYSKGILLAFHNYSDTHGALPPLYTVDDEGKPLHSWRVLILPFLDQQDLYNQIRLDEPWDSEYNKQFHDRMFYYYQCHSSPQKGCSFSVIWLSICLQ